jgi:Plasmid pRiA4b ORF-3-like protein
MDLAPAVVTPELAAAALASRTLADAIKLAEWVGDGREVTSEGGLHPDLVPQARELLGIESPEGESPEGESADEDPAEDFDPADAMLDGIWAIAQEAGFITVNDELARAADLPTDPEEILRLWLSVALEPFEIPGRPCAECVTLLAVLADAADPITVVAALEDALSDFVHDDEDEDDEQGLEHRQGIVAHMFLTAFSLRDLDAINVTEVGHPDQYTMRLTPLGQMLADTVFTVLAPAPDEMAGVVVRRFGELTPRIAARIAGPWLAGRKIPGAAAELLDYAAYARADQRAIAVGYVNTLGAEAAPAWRERVRDRGVGFYARTWLTEHGENVPVDGRDHDWMHVEQFSAHAAPLPEPLLVKLLSGLVTAEPDALAELQRAANRSRHPDAPKLLDAIAQVTGRPAVMARRDPLPGRGAVTGTSYRLRVCLRHVEGPPVWRAIAVDAGTALAELHEIIQAAMGWGDEHPHAFGFGGAEVSEAAPLARLIRKAGDRIPYTYDFGDNWEHDVILEDIDHNAGGSTLPVLLAGQGACPPEDCGGAPGYQWLKEIMADPSHEEYKDKADWLGADSFDPNEFELAGAAAAVNGLRYEHRVVAVVRTQQRRKKRRR